MLVDVGGIPRVQGLVHDCGAHWQRMACDMWHECGRLEAVHSAALAGVVPAVGELVDGLEFACWGAAFDEAKIDRWN